MDRRGQPGRGGFEDPYSFDLARTPNKHMAYGFGPHFCFGGALARIEMQILFEEIRDQVGSVSLAGDVEYSRSNFLTGVSRLPVAFTPSTLKSPTTEEA